MDIRQEVFDLMVNWEIIDQDGQDAWRSWLGIAGDDEDS